MLWQNLFCPSLIAWKGSSEIARERERYVLHSELSLQKSMVRDIKTRFVYRTQIYIIHPKHARVLVNATVLSRLHPSTAIPRGQLMRFLDIV